MPRDTALLKLVRFRAGIIGVAQLTSEMFSHTSTSNKKGVCDFPDVVWFFFYNLPKFDIVNVDVPFYNRGHNLEMEPKLNKAQYPFSDKVSLNMAADFLLIPSDNVRERTKNVHHYMQFYFIEKKTKNVL